MGVLAGWVSGNDSVVVGGVLLPPVNVCHDFFDEDGVLLTVCGSGGEDSGAARCFSAVCFSAVCFAGGGESSTGGLDEVMVLGGGVVFGLEFTGGVSS